MALSNSDGSVSRPPFSGGCVERSAKDYAEPAWFRQQATKLPTNGAPRGCPHLVVSAALTRHLQGPEQCGIALVDIRAIAQLAVVVDGRGPVGHQDRCLPGEPVFVGLAALQQPGDGVPLVLLEQQIDQFNAALQPLTSFILPGGTPLSVSLHLARTVTRRAERLVAALLEAEPETSVETLRYLNRLSDLLFVAARLIGKRLGTPEVLWAPRRNTEPKS